jgi:extracellular matrix regulatory protein B
MYLHIGDNQMVDVKKILAIFKVHPKKTGKSNPLENYYKKLIILGSGNIKDIRCYIVTEEYLYGTPITLETIICRYKQLFSS